MTAREIVSFPEDLSGLPFNWKDILLASPFESGHNLGGRLTEEAFYKALFVWSQKFEDTKKEFLRMLDPWDKDKFLIFFSGFSGNGKTTFIRRMCSELEYCGDYRLEHIYIDVAKAIYIIDGKPGNPKESSPVPVNPILLRLQEIMIDSLYGDHQNNLIHQFYFLRQYRQKLNAYFSPGFFTNLETEIQTSEEKIIDRNVVEKIIKNLGFNDTFLLYFFLLFDQIVREREEKIYILYFDNLDALDIEYISAKFPKQFSRLYKNILRIGQEFFSEIYSRPFDAKKKLRFVFSLREANSAEVNAHIKDINSPFIGEIEFSLASVGHRILEKRFQFAKQVCKKKAFKPEIRKIIRNLIHDEYTKRVFLPLFNFDYRKLTRFIIGFTEDSRDQIPELNLHRYNEVYLNKNNCSRFGARGILYYGFIRGLWESDFLKDFADNPQHNREDGLCNPIRVILTVLLNLCNYYSTLEPDNEQVMTDRVGLFDLVQTLEKLYSNERILKLLKKYFLCHKESWAHLITIYNKKILEDSDFRQELQLLEAYDRAVNNLEKEEIKARLNSVKVKINPSGFIYLKYLIIHFEFYSRLARNRTPLFGNTTGYDPVEDIYDFEEIIDRVWSQVKVHDKMMTRFWEKQFVKKRKYSSGKFSKSNFSFKYLGRIGFAERKSAHGQFHATRIINSHISYIDEFRHYLLHDEDFIAKVYQRKGSIEATAKELVRINSILIEKISLYLNYMDESVDQDAAKYFLPAYQKCINKIKAGKYSDFDIRISMEEAKKI